MIQQAITVAAAGRDLSEDEAAAAMEEMMTGQATPAQVAALLTALRMKGESIDEIAGMARVMREKALRVTVSGDLLDTCGTGGDGLGTFNVSTAAAFVCAGAGVRIAKHGNRAATSSSGSADVLEALGAKIELTPEQVQACIEKCGVGFMFAQAFHPAMRFVGPVRREIGIRTIFNFLGPLTNPAGAQYQLLGVGDESIAPKMAAVLGKLGTRRALVVHSEDGLDEVSLSSPTFVQELREGMLHAYTFTPEDAGLKRASLAELKGGTPEENAARIRRIFAGELGADRDFVLINAGAALMAAGKADDLKSAVELAAQSIESGSAGRALVGFITATQDFAEAKA
jgi:anthranilate phosphoribosyltransferase